MGDARGLLRIVHIICGWTDQRRRVAVLQEEKNLKERERLKILKR
jgi:uncharacterized protein YjiS (DUF1127 family)